MTVTSKRIYPMVLLLALVAGWARAQAPGEQAAPEPNTILREIIPLEQIYRQTEQLLDDPNRDVVELTLQECLQRALHNNLDVRVGGYDPGIRQLDIVSAEAAFDAVLFGSGQFDLTDQANIESGFYNQTILSDGGDRIRRIPTAPFVNAHDYNYLMGLRKLLPTGATIQVAEQLRRFRDLTDENALFRNPFYEFGLQLQIRQPLLRDFGVEVNEANIQATRNNYQISRQQFQLLLIRTASDVETNYWRLFSSRQTVKILEDLVRSSGKSLERIRRRYPLDTQSLNIERTLAVIKRAEANLVSAENALLQRQELLLQSLNDPDLPLEKGWEVIPIDQPTEVPYETDERQTRQTALQHRAEIIAQRYRLDTSGLAEQVARNQRLPRMDLFYQQEISGAGDSYDSSWKQQWQNETVNHVFGLSFEYPLRNRSAEAAFGQAQRRRQQENLTLKNIQEQVLTDVNTSVLNLRNTFREIAKRMEAAEAEKNVMLNHLAYEESGQRNTMTPEFLNLKLNTDERLANARISAIQSLIEYNLAIMNMQRAQGTLLRYNHIDIAEPRPDDRGTAPRDISNTGQTESN